MKLHNISVTPMIVKKVIMNFDLSKSSGSDCIPVVVLTYCEPELSYILARFFNKCAKESSFPDCCKVSLVPVFENVGEKLKTMALLVFFLWATRAVALDISKAFERIWHAGILHKFKSYGI